MRFIYWNELDKVCFQKDMAYRHYTELPRRTAFDKVVRVSAFHIGKNPKYEGHGCGLVSMDYNLFDTKSSGANVAAGAATRANRFVIKSKIISNQQLAEEFHNSVIRNQLPIIST